MGKGARISGDERTGGRADGERLPPFASPSPSAQRAHVTWGARSGPSGPEPGGRVPVPASCGSSCLSRQLALAGLQLLRDPLPFHPLQAVEHGEDLVLLLFGVMQDVLLQDLDLGVEL